LFFSLNDACYKIFFQASDLLYVPKKLREIKPQVVDIFLCNLKPNDRDTEWGTVVSKLVSTWIEEIRNMRDSGFFLTGKVKQGLYLIYY